VELMKKVKNVDFPSLFDAVSRNHRRDSISGNEK